MGTVGMQISTFSFCIAYGVTFSRTVHFDTLRTTSKPTTQQMANDWNSVVEITNKHMHLLWFTKIYDTEVDLHLTGWTGFTGGCATGAVVIVLTSTHCIVEISALRTNLKIGWKWHNTSVCSICLKTLWTNKNLCVTYHVPESRMCRVHSF